jgi:hypothetical protein
MHVHGKTSPIKIWDLSTGYEVPRILKFEEFVNTAIIDYNRALREDHLRETSPVMDDDMSIVLTVMTLNTVINILYNVL